MNHLEILNKLSKSKFRSNFHLKKEMIDYIDNKGINVILKHAYDFINKNIKPSYIDNDGKQTPMKGHPVFIAQHACACCCRSCLKKWHKIDNNKELTNNEVNYIVSLIMEWIRREYKNYNK